VALIRVGIVGAGNIANFHADAFRFVPDAEVVAVASLDGEQGRALARRCGVPNVFADYRELLRLPDLDAVTIACPNDLHARMTIDAAGSGKHVICEKPMALNLEECDAMIEACLKAGVLLLYAEQFLFAPKYVHAKMMTDEGALGHLYYVRHSWCHDGPHSDWFWDVERSGGGVLMDMGCHSIALARWVFDKAPIESVSAELGTFVHGDRTSGEDHSVCLLHFAGERMALVENSWAHINGADERAELYGSEGLTVADLWQGSSPTTTHGWTEEVWKRGFPNEMEHFVRCMRGDEQPRSTGEDGRAVLEAIMAAYAAAGRGDSVSLPFAGARQVKKPIDAWRTMRRAQGRPGSTPRAP
jgi:myo-inositol 2-dehydrogenase/D-chiro-inositol 1-dehydrogenase